MWETGFQSAENIVGHLAVIIGGIASAVLAARSIMKQPKSKADASSPQIIQGQSIPVTATATEEPWVTDMRESNKRLRKRLEKALLRLAVNGIEYEDI